MIRLLYLLWPRLSDAAARERQRKETGEEREKEIARLRVFSTTLSWALVLFATFALTQYILRLVSRQVKKNPSSLTSVAGSNVRFRLDNLGPQLGSRIKGKRKGRGHTVGQGGSCGFGMIGQKSRSGPGVRKGFEGGQIPLYRHIPKLRGIAGGACLGGAPEDKGNHSLLVELEIHIVLSDEYCGRRLPLLLIMFGYYTIWQVGFRLLIDLLLVTDLNPILSPMPNFTINPKFSQRVESIGL
ncbi:Ribosomal protein L18e/L15P [Dillenia turbinata]|uniref:Ribosomal protein L18e/L15P n=1 Tax=Dillenia turbinata TaxID=194707 RepID=A0AAN8Z1V5_9MAGN